MNMTRENYPKAAAYVRLWRNAKRLPAGYVEPDPRVAWDWGWDGATIKRRFADALHNRINIRGRLNMSGRRWDSEYQHNLFRDQRALHDKLQKRIAVRRFLTDIVRRRFGLLEETMQDAD